MTGFFDKLMGNLNQIEGKLSEIRQQHTGKVPFGPIHELKRLFESEDEEGKRILLTILEERRDDPFWGYFVKEFFERLN